MFALTDAWKTEHREENPSSLYYDAINPGRYLAPLPDDQKPKRSDYSILSVAVMTLGLIMAVEFGRHRLDHSAIGRPFFQAVLQGVYAELSTLGLVELMIWLLISYYDNINIAKEKVFAKVHFTLFYTAIFNAFQTVVVAFFTCRVSSRLWVNTETLELDHYVEIREEFDRVREQLHLQNNRQDGTLGTQEGQSNTRTEFVFTFSRDGWASLGHGLMDQIKHPRLKSRYHELLVQVRFHELRIYFLQAYQLPLKFKVSDYLIKSEQAMLIKLVHVSTMAWLMLTACINILYFAMGILSWQTEKPSLVGRSMIWIFFITMTLFVLAALVVFNKMKAIYKSIMHDPSLWNPSSQREGKDDLIDHQKSLFWGNRPSYVIAAIQFMQFGYAIALAVCLIFWDTIEKGPVNMATFLLTIFACYSIFVLVTAQTLPRYTMCTSLGQLVDKRRLNETLANYHLEEERQRQLLETLDASQRAAAPGQGSTGASNGSSSTLVQHALSNKKAAHHEVLASLVKTDTESLRQELPELDRERLDLREQRRRQRKQRYKTLSDGVAAMAAMKSAPPRRAMDDMFLNSSAGDRGDASTASGGSSSKGSRVDRIAARTRSRRARRKSVSDGVAAMAWTQSAFSIDEDEEGASTVDSLIPLTVTGGTTDVINDNGSEDRPSAKVAHLTSMRPLAKPSLSSIRESSSSFRRGEQRKLSTPAASAASEEATEDIDSNASEDGHSDFDDVPSVDPKTLERLAWNMEHKQELVTLSERFREFFLSRRRKVASNVFGTLVVFFFVGQRVERFLHTDGIVGTGFVSFDFHHSVSFIFLTVWFFSFIFVDFTAIYVLGPWNAMESSRERKVVLSSWIDLLITVTCLVLLFAAEWRRCCTEDAEGDVVGSRSLAGEGEKEEVLQPAPCSCPRFGTRTYGGLGNIEPYVSLIGLRVTRFWVSSKAIAYFNSRNTQSSVKEESKELEEIDLMDPFDVFDELGGAGRHESPKIGTAVELWEEVIGKYPEIATKYGKFSSEVLKLMLAIPIPKEEAQDDGNKAHSRTDKVSSTTAREYSVPAEYSSLPINAQEIIVAGQLGHSVKPSLPLDGTGLSDSTPLVTSRNRHAAQHVTFQKVESTSQASLDSTFLSPNSRLVRSMRRGDRKLLPILENWGPVDVVLTRFEMVYFEVTGVDDKISLPQAQGVKQAMNATKGGKGLRLSDVAMGRRVVGHLKLSDISAIYVDREMPTPELDEAEDAVLVSLSEFWHNSGKGDLPKRQWNRVKEDSIRIESVHGHTLKLRFYSDYDDCQVHTSRMMMENESEGPLFKNNAFQWVQTIARFCGPDQLAQELPHFGDDSVDELRDYLIVANPDKEKQGLLPLRPRSIAGHHRTSSMGDVRALVTRPLPGITRATTVGSRLRTERPARARRAYSGGEAKKQVSRLESNANVNQTLTRRASSVELLNQQSLELDLEANADSG